MAIDIHPHFDEATNTVSYVVADRATRRAAIIDPVLDFDPKAAQLGTGTADALLGIVEKEGLSVDWILETHAHADHLTAAHYLRRRTGAGVAIGKHITEVQRIFMPIFEIDDTAPDGAVFDRLVADGDRLALGDSEFRVIHTPGHTPADVTYVIDDAAFVGDTLFMPDYGTARADFPGGDAATLYRSIRKIYALPDETRVFVCHDYLPEGRDQHAWETTVAAEKAANVHAREGISEADFVAMRERRDATLAAPTLILPSLQVNVRAGELPKASGDGHVFLRLPLNVFPELSPLPEGI